MLIIEYLPLFILNHNINSINRKRFDFERLPKNHLKLNFSKDFYVYGKPSINMVLDNTICLE